MEETMKTRESGNSERNVEKNIKMCKKKSSYRERNEDS